MKHIGIIGGGGISQTHARAAQDLHGAVEVSAFYGDNYEKTARLSELYGAAVYRDLQSFLNHRPLDIVIIGSPSGLHAEQGIAAARRGLHVLTEKPIDVTTARAMRSSANASAPTSNSASVFRIASRRELRDSSS